MEEPPIIDIEPEGSAKSRAATAIGCFIQFIPIATVGLALILGALAVALFIWGGNSREDAADALTKPPAPAAETGAPAEATTPKSPAETEPAAPSIDGPSVVSQVTTTPRGATSYGVAKGSFAGSGTQVSYEVVFQPYAEGIGYRLFILPYDSRVDRLFRANRGRLGVTFLDGAGQQIAPKQGMDVAPLSDFSAYESQGAPAGWMKQGVVPLDGVTIADIQAVKLAWEFEEDLNLLLQQLASERR